MTVQLVGKRLADTSPDAVNPVVWHVECPAHDDYDGSDMAGDTCHHAGFRSFGTFAAAWRFARHHEDYCGGNDITVTAVVLGL